MKVIPDDIYHITDSFNSAGNKAKSIDNACNASVQRGTIFSGRMIYFICFHYLFALKPSLL
jgi:hypothetical protein